MNNDCNVDWDFIRQLEGFSSKGYVPEDDKKGIESGVTIACGFDLGQQSKTSLLSYKLSFPLLQKLLPYIGVVGDKAKELIKNKPLLLSQEELAELDDNVKVTYYKKVEDEYNHYSDFTFSFLDSAKQTVICSVSFQYGSLKIKCPTFFKCVTRGLWKLAVAELEDFGDHYTTRRLKEAALLKSSLLYK